MVDDMSLRLHATTVTDVGLVRSNNEDAAHAGTNLVALADGIGGMPAGELASSVVVRLNPDAIPYTGRRRDAQFRDEGRRRQPAAEQRPAQDPRLDRDRPRDRGPRHPPPTTAC